LSGTALALGLALAGASMAQFSPQLGGNLMGNQAQNNPTEITADSANNTSITKGSDNTTSVTKGSDNTTSVTKTTTITPTTTVTKNVTADSNNTTTITPTTTVSADNGNTSTVATKGGQISSNDGNTSTVATKGGQVGSNTTDVTKTVTADSNNTTTITPTKTVTADSNNTTDVTKTSASGQSGNTGSNVYSLKDSNNDTVKPVSVQTLDTEVTHNYLNNSSTNGLQTATITEGGGMNDAISGIQTVVSNTGVLSNTQAQTSVAAAATLTFGSSTAP
jgi:hypothetical protein